MGKSLRSLLFLIVFIGIITPTMGHQPFFEDKEFTFDCPGHIRDPTISTAMYATLETPTNVDYYDFNGSKGESIFLSITIPQIAGQVNFAPTMALIGPSLHNVDLPKNVTKPKYSGTLILPPPANTTLFFEPFSRTSYWTRQEQNVTLPANGSYLVAVWDDKGQIGRYVFVIGYKEVLGGDLAFPLRIRNYWKPFDAVCPDPKVCSTGK
ncbi:Uncharacterised protein [uncultured archaeon]|nr:Uncharacterised protein [uncultured archaeon]